MLGKIKYEFAALLWKHPSTGGWYFISLPENLSQEIRENFKWQEEGWGRLKARTQIGNTKWETAIWFDKKMKTYLLPVKAEIRNKAGLETGKTYKVEIWV